jgi:hypothetical protein
MGKRSLRIAGGDVLVCVNLVGLDVVPEDVGWNVRRNVAQALVIKPSRAVFARMPFRLGVPAAMLEWQRD